MRAARSAVRALLAAVAPAAARKAPGLAGLADVPRQYRRYARHVPPDTLQALCRAELACRAQFAAELELIAGSLPAADASSFRIRSRVVMESEPVWDNVQRRRQLSGMADEAGDQDTRMDIAAMAREHRDSHEYPPGLAGTVECVRDRRVPRPDMADIAAAIVFHHDR